MVSLRETSAPGRILNASAAVSKAAFSSLNVFLVTYCRYASQEHGSKEFQPAEEDRRGVPGAAGRRGCRCWRLAEAHPDVPRRRGSAVTEILEQVH